MVRAAGVEPTTSGFGGQRSIQLSYARSKLRMVCAGCVEAQVNPR